MNSSLFLTGDPDQAKAICARCPVTVECEDFRALTGEEDGVWGGRSAVDRATDKYTK